MIQLLSRLPLVLLLALIAGAAMLIPAAQALVLRQYGLAIIFFDCAAAVALLVALIAIALAGTPTDSRIGRSHGGLTSLMLSLTLLPGVLAWPVVLALPDTGYLNAWWEMLSCLTTTGATLYDPAALPAPLHLWRGLAGWMGGLLTLAAAVAILAPLQVGGFELVSTPISHTPAAIGGTGAGGRGGRPLPGGPRLRTARTAGDAGSLRLLRAMRALLPLYGGATVALWTGLTIAGEPGFAALMRALGTVSASGISAVPGPAGGQAGLAGEIMIMGVMLLALSRRFWPGGDALRTTRRLRDDPELKIAAAAVVSVALAVLVRQVVASAGQDAAGPGAVVLIRDALAVFWGAGFTALSYLTTTGWTSQSWDGAVAWSGLQEPGLILAGLAIIGGGAATTAGGVKLLRIAALARHGGHEMEKIVHPAAVAGGGQTWRRLRTVGAFLAFVSFMLFAVGLAVVVLLVTMQRVEFETATVLSIAALSNTGPLMQAVAVSPALGGNAGIAGSPWEGWAGLPGLTKAVLAAAMVVGRLEIVAILALFSPGYWRR